MSIDERLRQGLLTNAEVPLPPVERQLETVQRRHRRRAYVRVLSASAAVVVLLLVTPVLVIRILDGRDPDPAASPGSLPGTYRVVVDRSGAGAGVRGTWTVTLTPDGRVTLAPPASYAGPTAGGATYALAGERITTNVFIASPGCQRTVPPVGTYRATPDAEGVQFTRLADDCPARRALFDATWVRLP